MKGRILYKNCGSVMYDINFRRKIQKNTVGNLIEKLKELPQDAEILVCGEDIFFLHIERDKTVVCLDTEDLETDYIDDAETSPEDFWANRNLLENTEK